MEEGRSEKGDQPAADEDADPYGERNAGDDLHPHRRIGATVLRATEGEDKPMPRFAKPLALASIATWIALILAGRFLAYTHRWEMLGVPAIL